MIIFLGPSLLPGKTLSNSDSIWFDPPWVTVKPSSLVTPSNPELADAPLQLQLFLHHTARALPHIPLWNPNIMGGRPFEANSQSAIFSPFSLPAYVLGFWTALGWIGVLKLWAAAFGTFLLGRSLGMRFGGALLAGVVFALNLKMVTWISYPHMSVWALIPWQQWLTERLVRRPDLLTGAALGLAVGLQFLCGHAESSFHALLATIPFFALRLWQARRAAAPAEIPLRRAALTFVAALAGGVALAAIALVPFGELLWLSSDLHDRSGESVDMSLALKEAVGIFLPDYWGRPTQSPVRLFLLERALYVGALPLMLAVAGVALRPRLERVCVALFGGLWFCVVLGIPPFLQVITRLPVFSSGHNTRLIVLTMLSIALLAGWGLDEVAARRGSPARQRIVLGVAVVLLVIPVLLVAVGDHVGPHDLVQGFKVAWLFVHPPGGFRDVVGVDVIRASSLIIWLTVAATAVGLLLLARRGRLGAASTVALAIILVCVDLFRAGMGFNPAIHRADASVPVTPAIRYLQHQGLGRVAATVNFPQNILAFEFGLQEARGYDLPIVRRYNRVWRREIEPGVKLATGLFVPLELPQVSVRALRTLRLLGVTHVLSAKSIEAETPPTNRLVAVPPLRVPGVTQVYDGRDARIYRVDGALPRTWMVGAQQVVDGDEAALNALLKPSFDARGAAITERGLAGLPGAAASSGPAPGRARITSYADERVVIQARASRRGLLVLGDNTYPGWKAEVDGRSVPIERVDYLFRGVPVGRGTHTVVFRYEPLSWRIGWIVSLLALVGLGLCVLVGWRRRRTAQLDRRSTA